MTKFEALCTETCKLSLEAMLLKLLESSLVPSHSPKRTEGGKVWVHRPNFWVMLTLQKVTASPTKLINWTIVPPAS